MVLVSDRWAKTDQRLPDAGYTMMPRRPSHILRVVNDRVALPRPGSSGEYPRSHRTCAWCITSRFAGDTLIAEAIDPA